MGTEYSTSLENHIFEREQLPTPEMSHLAIIDYPLLEVVSNPAAFFEAVDQMYAREKRKVKPNTQLQAGIDLSKSSHLRRMDWHTKVHVVTGIAEWGGSNTENIPYWDRQSLFAGFDHVFPQEAEQLKLQFDVENINGLRAVIGMIAPRLSEANRYVDILENKLSLGMITRSNIDDHLEGKLEAWQVIRDDYQYVITAKVRHLLYLSDKLPLRATREFILNEAEEIILTSGISTTHLTINMGIDGGLSEETYRPPYYIVGVRQLAHLGTETVQIPHEVCPDWTYETITDSLMRDDFADTYLYEPPEFFLQRVF